MGFPPLQNLPLGHEISLFVNDKLVGSGYANSITWHHETKAVGYEENVVIDLRPFNLSSETFSFLKRIKVAIRFIFGLGKLKLS